MVIYWLLFSYFAIGAISGSKNTPAVGFRPAMVIGTLLLVVLIGLRFEVGADWPAYEVILSKASRASFSSAVSIGDPGFQALNWSVAAIGFDVWLVNLACAIIFVWGLVRLANIQPSPFLAIVVAVPYLVIVVAMGYTRQAAAIGIIMAGLASFEKGGSVIRFAAYVAVAALFHKTAVLVLPLVIFAGHHSKFVNALAGLFLVYGLYSAFLSTAVDGLVSGYIDARYSSQGAAVRVAMNVAAAALFFMARTRLEFTQSQGAVWKSFSLAAFALLVGLFVVPSTTAIDRMALYIIPLQIVVISRGFLLFQKRETGKLLVVCYSAIVQFTWLTFATHSKYWVPYYFYLFKA